MIFLGKIVKSRGNKGEVVIVPSPEFASHVLEHGEVVLLKSAKYEKEKEIDYCKEICGAPVFKFKDTHSINDAFKLVGYLVYTNKTVMPGTAAGITGFTVKDMNGQVWGTVKNLQEPGLNQLLEVETPSGRLIDVPYTDAIIKEIDEEKKVVLIDPPEGLKELNRA